MQLLIGGDLVPTPSNFDYFSNGDVTALLGDELLSAWNATDMRIFNLEVPLTDNVDPIAKCGPNLIAPTNTVRGIKALNPTLLALANNHILDQGEQGLKSTEQVLSDNEIQYVGIGDNLSEASKPYILVRDDIKIGVYACAEHEFTIATATSSGANPFDPLESLDHIQNLKTKCNYVIVLYHGGKEHYRYPSPYLQRVCRKIVDKGADIVVCQHSHCIGCYEKYNNATIVYGQGNFLFDHIDSIFWQTSLLIKVNISNGLQVEYIPIVKAGNGVRLAAGQVAEDILSAFLQRSDEILQNGFVEQQYRQFAQENRMLYLRSFSAVSKWLLRIDRWLLNERLLKRNLNNEKLLLIYNYIKCEAHRELVIYCLSDKRKDYIEAERSKCKAPYDRTVDVGKYDKYP